MARRCGVLAAGLLVAVFASVDNSAAATAAAAPTIISFTATQQGALVLLKATVRRAATCTFSSPRGSRTVACKSGRVRVTLPGPTTASVTYTLVVQGVGKAARRAVAVAPPQPSASLTLSASTVAWSGGSIHLTYTATNATSCTLAASPTVWSGANPASVRCSGTYTATVASSTTAGSWTFTFTATNAAGSATANQTLTQLAPPVPTAALTSNVTTVHSTGGPVHLTLASTNATSCTLSATPNKISIGAPSSGGFPSTAVPCNGTYDATIPASSFGRSVAFTFSAANGAGQAATSTQTVLQPGSSDIWSGYVYSSSSTITSVSGTWTVPRLNCAHTPNAGASQWVGIGGAGDGSNLLQTGIRTDCEGGVQTNVGWWELIEPLPEIDFALTISPGDTIQASVFQWSDGSRWETRVDDLTTGISGVMVTGQGWGILRDGDSNYAIAIGGTRYNYLTYPGAKSAEWVVEDYTNVATGAVAFADFGTITFTNMSTSLSGWSLTLEDALELVRGGSILAAPTAPSSATSFTVAYTG